MTNPGTRTLNRLGLKRMIGRDSSENHRAASPLELFFDLVFVVAVSQAAQNLHHGISEGHALKYLLSYGMIFFAIWWAWMNFTWFASAFDTDDWLYRVTTIVQMGGVLVLAAGIHPAMAEGHWELVTWGYVIMRIAMVAQWLRLAYSDPEQRPAALRFAIGITLVQVFWVGRIMFSADVQFWTFWVGLILELLVPLWAEKAHHTPWHPHHIAERYGCFTLIVLGESLLASSNAIFDVANTGEHIPGLVGLAVAGMVIAAAMWWMYFSEDQIQRLTSTKQGFVFGYAHFFLFAAAGAVSAGIEVELDWLTNASEHLSAATASWAVALPIAVFMVAVWVILLRSLVSGWASTLFVTAIVGVLASDFLPVMQIAGIATCVLFAVIVLEVDRTKRAEALATASTA